ncbi:MAG: uroporphyrinogen decarboxylase family protein [Candidatus Eremiobacterota bacterium]
MNSMERVLTALSHKEPDRVPLFLALTLHGAKELGLSIKEYFAKAEHVVKGQLILREKYHNDFFYGFFYAPLEIKAWGGEVIYYDDGPPNSGSPPVKKKEDIKTLSPPSVKNCPCLLEVLKAIGLLKEKAGNEVPIVGVVMSPFSLPVMQLGFDNYIELMYEQKDLFDYLMMANEVFCSEWANAQLEAGATAICYFDPVSSPIIIPKEVYKTTGMAVAMRTLSAIKGPTATHFASGLTLPVMDDVIKTGTAIIGVSSDENLSLLKESCRGKITILGNLNGIKMRKWTEKEAEEEVKQAIRKAAHGGGFILSDTHGEIPWHVPENVLLSISEAVRTWGGYPLERVF